MKDIALIVKRFEDELRRQLKHSRSGLFKDSSEHFYVKGNVQLGMKYNEDVIGTFADEKDLDLYFKLYLGES